MRNATAINLAQVNKKQDDYLLKKVVNKEIKIENFDEIVLKSKMLVKNYEMILKLN